MDWETLYADTGRTLPGLARSTGPILAGLTACVDLCVQLTDDDIHTLQELKADAPEPAGEFANSVLGAISAGRGGEHAYGWEDGPAWIEDHFRTTEDLGGTGARVARTLAGLGGSAVLCLANRSPRTLRLIHPNVLLSSPSGLRRAGDTPASVATDNVHYILEFRAGTRVGDAVVPRSDRLIVRFADLDLESSGDEHFVRRGHALAGSPGAGVLSGFNELSPGRLQDGLRSSRGLASAWRAGGVGLIHLELAGYVSGRKMRDVTACVAEACDSIGMNAAELDDLIPGTSPVPSKLARAADAYGLARVCAHGDRWAMSVTTGPPDREMLALLAGNAVASSLARKGTVEPGDEHIGLEAATPPPGSSFGIHRLGDRWLVACPVPYVERPVVTVGLGDSFLAGTLLVLGNEDSRDKAIGPAQALFPGQVRADA